VLNLSANDSSEFKYGVSDSETTGKRTEMANGLQILKTFWISHKLQGASKWLELYGSWLYSQVWWRDL